MLENTSNCRLQTGHRRLRKYDKKLTQHKNTPASNWTPIPACAIFRMQIYVFRTYRTTSEDCVKEGWTKSETLFERDRGAHMCFIMQYREGLRHCISVTFFLCGGATPGPPGRPPGAADRRMRAFVTTNAPIECSASRLSIFVQFGGGETLRKVRLAIHNGSGSKSWVWQKKNESRINAEEMRSLRSVCGVSRKDRCRGSGVRGRSGLKEDVVTRVEMGMVRWFGHQETMSDSRLTKQIYRANVCGKDKYIRNQSYIKGSITTVDQGNLTGAHAAEDGHLGRESGGVWGWGARGVRVSPEAPSSPLDNSCCGGGADPGHVTPGGPSAVGAAVPKFEVAAVGGCDDCDISRGMILIKLKL
ncbi:hypothetical protein EVAR_29918_1 [Eumeta japonica]|uniref:Uncharacterized protein n=1 Tax=Eumeta variegata TaxID=151549 RepID=A0A4C1V6S5_EUMVA|nr:hypothetical protein EVAR_29918_1 [Eumeta japonica]